MVAASISMSQLCPRNSNQEVVDKVWKLSYSFTPAIALRESDVSVKDSSTVTKVVVATTVMLSFISFWRAAAIVLCDLGSSAYYAGGLAEGFVGKSAPWFIFAIMLFSSMRFGQFIVESCSMFVRGGVYRVVHEALGGTLAKFSVSALMFDYVLTGPISGVSAGLYLAGLINATADLLQSPGIKVNPSLFAALFTIAVTLYFWRKNIIGMHEWDKALRIMQLTTVMVVLLIIWSLITIIQRGYSPVPLSKPEHRFISAKMQSGGSKGTIATKLTLIAVLIGLGHSILAMSGEESLAQVNREIASPKLLNLKRTGLVVDHFQHVIHLARFLLCGYDHSRPRTSEPLPG